MENKKGIYLAAYKALHKNYNIIYQDINNTRDIGGDMLDVDLSPYDFIIATPPCNWWSKANPYYYKSEYSLKTRHLLPLIIIKLATLGKPFIVENVKNIKRMSENGIFKICDEYNVFVYVVGRHIYFTNIFINLNCKQHFDFKNGGILINNDGHRQGGENVYNVIEIFLKYIHEYTFQLFCKGDVL